MSNRALSSGNRKRRAELRRQDSNKRQHIDTVASSDSEEEDKQKPSLRGIKKQARYVPGVPMTRDELTQWRKEARRVRNRESAAASRAKTRDRIETLEGELDGLKMKYTAALQRLLEIQGDSSDYPSVLRQDIEERRRLQGVVSPTCSPAATPQVTPVIPHDVLSLDHSHASQLDFQPNMISRPTAVCV